LVPTRRAIGHIYLAWCHRHCRRPLLMLVFLLQAALLFMSSLPPLAAVTSAPAWGCAVLPLALSLSLLHRYVLLIVLRSPPPWYFHLSIQFLLTPTTRHLIGRERSGLALHCVMASGPAPIPSGAWLPHAAALVTLVLALAAVPSAWADNVDMVFLKSAVAKGAGVY
jgi:hypothetical protein